MPVSVDTRGNGKEVNNVKYSCLAIPPFVKVICKSHCMCCDIIKQLNR